MGVVGGVQRLLSVNGGEAFVIDPPFFFFFRPQNFFLLPFPSRAAPKIVSIFRVPIFGNVDGSWRVTSKLRGSTLIQVARRCSKVFQRFSASLVQVGVVQGVPR